MKLRNRQRIVSGGPEGTAPERRGPRITAGLYYMLLVTVLGYVVFYIGGRILNFRAPGIVSTSTVLVAPAREGRVAELPYGPGDTVRAGALVARIEPGIACRPADPTLLSALRMDARLNRARATILGERLDAQRARTSELYLRDGLELDMELRRERDRLDLEITELELQQRLLSAEIALQSEALETGELETASRAADDPACLPDLVRAPVDGTVHTTHLDAFSVVNAGDPVLSLKPLNPPVRVIAYANPDILPSLFPGKAVRIRFPDGSRGDGVIDAVHAAAELFPRMDVEDYRYLGSEVLVEIRPADPARSAHWRGFDRLPVRVTGRRRGS